MTNVVYNGKLFTNHCIDSTSKTYHGNQWVRVEVLVLGDSVVKHIVQGDRDDFSEKVPYKMKVEWQGPASPDVPLHRTLKEYNF